MNVLIIAVTNVIKSMEAIVIIWFIAIMIDFIILAVFQLSECYCCYKLQDLG